MQRNAHGRALPFIIALLAAGALALGNVLLFAQSTDVLCGGRYTDTLLTKLRVASRIDAPSMAYAALAPVLAVMLAMLLISDRRRADTAAPAAPSAPATPTAPPGASALRFLALLQQEGRFLDFIEEDIDGYGDDQVGAAVRSIHAGCRKAVHDRMQIARIFAEDDGSTVELAPGFDAATVRLTGNVHGQPPFRGTLQHGGWRATEVALPAPSADLDATILAPAEIEIP